MPSNRALLSSLNEGQSTWIWISSGPSHVHAASYSIIANWQPRERLSNSLANSPWKDGQWRSIWNLRTVFRPNAHERQISKIYPPNWAAEAACGCMRRLRALEWNLATLNAAVPAYISAHYFAGECLQLCKHAECATIYPRDNKCITLNTHLSKIK